MTPVAIPPCAECIEILTGGRLFFTEEGAEREYRRGAVFWHLSCEKTIWKTVREAPYRCIVFHFSVSETVRLAPRVSIWERPEGAAEFAEDCLKTFHAGISQPDLFRLYTYSTLLWNATQRTPPPPWPAGLQSAVNFINRNWHRPLDIAELARASGTSKSYLFSLFRQHLKISPHQHLLQQRIQQAKVMLASADTPIKEIAFACGFGSVEVFYRQFKTVAQITPYEYRKGLMPYNFSVRT